MILRHALLIVVYGKRISRHDINLQYKIYHGLICREIQPCSNANSELTRRHLVIETTRILWDTLLSGTTCFFWLFRTEPQKSVDTWYELSEVLAIRVISIAKGNFHKVVTSILTFWHFRYCRLFCSICSQTRLVFVNVSYQLRFSDWTASLAKVLFIASF